MDNNIGQGLGLSGLRTSHRQDRAARANHTDPRIEIFINSLPILSLTDLPEENQDCPICMEYFRDTQRDTPVRLPCKHIMGKDCLFLWLSSSVLNRNNNTCPTCRTVLLGRGHGPSPRPHALSESSMLVLRRELTQLHNAVSEYCRIPESERTVGDYNLIRAGLTAIIVSTDDLEASLQANTIRRELDQEHRSEGRFHHWPLHRRAEQDERESRGMVELANFEARLDVELESLHRMNTREIERQDQFHARLREDRAKEQQRRIEFLKERHAHAEGSMAGIEQQERPATQRLNRLETALRSTTTRLEASANHSESSRGLNGRPARRQQQQARPAAQRSSETNDTLRFTLPRLEARMRMTAGIDESSAPREAPAPRTEQQQARPAAPAAHPFRQTNTHLPYTLPRQDARRDARIAAGRSARARRVAEDPLTRTDRQQTMPPAPPPNRTNDPAQPPIGTPRTRTRRPTARDGTLNERIRGLGASLTRLEHEHLEITTDLDRLDLAESDRDLGANVGGGTARLGDGRVPTPADRGLAGIERRIARLGEGLARAAEQQRALDGSVADIARAQGGQ